MPADKPMTWAVTYGIAKASREQSPWARRHLTFSDAESNLAVLILIDAPLVAAVGSYEP
jgi:hypothetical protein